MSVMASPNSVPLPWNDTSTLICCPSDGSTLVPVILPVDSPSSSPNMGGPPCAPHWTQKITGARHNRRGRFHLLLPAVGVTTQRQASAGGGSSSSSPTPVPVPWPGAGARHQDGVSPSLRAILVAPNPFAGCGSQHPRQRAD